MAKKNLLYPKGYKKVNLDKTDIAQKYYDNKMSATEIAKHYGVCHSYIINFMRLNGIKRRTREEAWQLTKEKHTYTDPATGKMRWKNGKQPPFWTLKTRKKGRRPKEKVR